MNRINLQLDFTKLEEEANIKLAEQFKKKYQETINDFIYSFFSHETAIRKKGIARELLETQCLDLLLNEEQTKTIIKKYAEQNWERILQEATERALRHKANGLAFKNIRGE